MTINILNTSTIEKIAAGEVIENPRSIVKELVENSIDASATNIKVSLKSGGIEEIIVSDNGSGIDDNSIILAFERHATSKILSFDDLYSSYYFGFRGEALASIKACSKVTVSTKTIDRDLGTKVQFNELDIKKSEIAMNKGTVIQVTNLFYNTPVRKKFLSSENVEASKVSELLKELAIGNNISIEYYLDDKLIFKTFKDSTIEQKMIQLISKNLEGHIISFEMQNELYNVKAYISDNTFFRANRKNQYIYVNNRIIDSKDISISIEKAYSSIIPNGKFPSFVLFISTEANNLDVNIHPNKKNISFSNFEQLLEDLYISTKNSLKPDDLFIHTPDGKDYNNKPKFYNQDNNFINNEQKLKDLLERYNNNKSNTSYHNNENNNISEVNEDKSDYEEEYLSFNSYESNDSNIDSNKNELSFIEDDSSKYKEFINRLEYRGSLFNTYLIFEDKSNETSYFMDQHAAHERVMYEKF